MQLVPAVFCSLSKTQEHLLCACAFEIRQDGATCSAALVCFPSLKMLFPPSLSCLLKASLARTELC